MTDNLIERLEKATGPDRELDAALADAVLLVTVGRALTFADQAPLYTWSIDAALTLAPQGFQSYCCTGVGEGDAHACVWTDHPHRISGGARQAPTPAIALCIAALKARASLTTPEGK